MMRTYTLEVRADFDDPRKHEAMREALKIFARNIRANVTLLQEKRSPNFLLLESDFDSGTEQIEIDEVEEEDGE